MIFDYPISKIEIHPHDAVVQVFIERKKQLVEPDTGIVDEISTWRTSIPVEELNNLEQFLSRDGAALSAANQHFITHKLKPALEILGIQPSPASGIEGEANI